MTKWSQVRLIREEMNYSSPLNYREASPAITEPVRQSPRVWRAGSFALVLDLFEQSLLASAGSCVSSHHSFRFLFLNRF
jgi:hypothetical protein